MKNKLIKIIAVVIVVAGIVALVFATMHHEKREAYTPLPKHDFAAYIQSESQRQIANAANNSLAHEGYDRLYTIVNTEANIGLTDGRLLLPADGAITCYEQLFNDYFPKFEVLAEDLFQSASWNATELNYVKSESEYLLSKKGNDAKKSTLNSYVGYVVGYSNALDLKQKAAHCTNARSYQNIVSNASTYAVKPYTNSNEITTSFVSNCQNSAKASWESSIHRSIVQYCSRYDTNSLKRTHFTLDDCKTDYNSTSERIDEYYNTLGVTIKEKDKLDNAYDIAANYFERKELESKEMLMP